MRGNEGPQHIAPLVGAVETVRGLLLIIGDLSSLDQFLKELSKFPLSGCECFFSFFGGRVLAPGAAAFTFDFDREIASLLEPMQ